MYVTSTFSVAGRCRSTGSVGAVVTSSSPAVGARCVRGKAGVGIILTQNVTDPRLTDIGLTALEMGYGARGAVEAMKSASPFPSFRQLAVVDAGGESAVFTGEKALRAHGEFCSTDVACIGNLLCDTSIPEAMAKHFLDHEDLALVERLLSAIEVGFEMGGELDQERSIALLVYRDDPFPYVDLRVDYSDSPLQDLLKLWEIYGPQAEAYRTRALDPQQAPPFGVRGDN